MVGLKAWARRLWKTLSKTQLNLLANSLSFTTLLSLIPFFAVVFGLIAFLDRFDFLMPRIETLMLDHFRDTMGPGTLAWVKKSVGRLQNAHIGVFGAAFLLIGSLQILRDLDLGIQLIFSQKHKHRAWKRYLFYWLALLGLPLAAALFVTVTAIPIFGDTVGFLGDGWLFILGVLLCIHKLMPPVKVRWRVAFTASFVSLAGLFLVQSSFGFLVKQVFNYSKVYGSFATLPALMIYVLLAWYMVLAGLVVNSSLSQNQTRRTRDADEKITGIPVSN